MMRFIRALSSSSLSGRFFASCRVGLASVIMASVSMTSSSIIENCDSFVADATCRVGACLGAACLVTGTAPLAAGAEGISTPCATTGLAKAGSGLLARLAAATRRFALSVANCRIGRKSPFQAKASRAGRGAFEHAGTAARTESIVEADTHDIVPIVTGRRGKPQAQLIGDRRNLGRTVGADVKILELRGPVAPQGHLDTGARCPPERAVRQRQETRGRSCNRHAQIVKPIHQRGAAGHVGHEPIERQAEATAPSRRAI
jgi:hypothetical protein